MLSGPPGRVNPRSTTAGASRRPGGHPRKAVREPAIWDNRVSTALHSPRLRRTDGVLRRWRRVSEFLRLEFRLQPVRRSLTDRLKPKVQREDDTASPHSAVENYRECRKNCVQPRRLWRTMG